MKFPIETIAIGGAMMVLAFCTTPTKADGPNPAYMEPPIMEPAQCRILFGLLPCSGGPYHINSGGNGPDMGTPPQSKPTRPTRPGNPATPTEPDDEDDYCPPEHEGPDDDGVGGPYGGWDTPRGGV